MKKLALLVFVLVLTSPLFAQNVSITDDSEYSADSSAMLDVKSTDKGFLPPRMTEDQRNAITSPAEGLLIYQTNGTTGLYQYNGTSWSLVCETPDGSETKVTAGTNVTVTGSGTTASPYVVNASGITTYSVGDFAQGGIVFWVDETGQHGLVCAKEDQSTGVRWWAGTHGNTQAKGDGPYAGEANTSIIIAAQVAIGDDGSTYAARICNKLQITEGGKTYGDWYLPSRKELNLMYQNKATINATAGANGGSSFSVIFHYWSSTEINSHLAWEQSFDDGYQDYFDKASINRVRAVRAF